MDKEKADKKDDKDKKEVDFFSQLQQNEREKGIQARGKGHGWITFAETLMGDW